VGTCLLHRLPQCAPQVHRDLPQQSRQLGLRREELRRLVGTADSDFGPKGPAQVSSVVSMPRQKVAGECTLVTPAKAGVQTKEEITGRECAAAHFLFSDVVET